MIFTVLMVSYAVSSESGRTVSLNGNERDKALERADERLTTGEIKPEEFESIKRSLEL